MNREKAVVIDVCEPAEFAQGHVVGSKNIPLGQLEEQLPLVVKNKNLPDFFIKTVLEISACFFRYPKALFWFDVSDLL